MTFDDSAGASVAAALQDARSGDKDALAVVFRYFHPRVLRYLRAWDPVRADEIAASLWVTVARGLRLFEGDVNMFSAHLFTLARSRLGNVRRPTDRRRALEGLRLVDRRQARLVEERTMDGLGAQDAVDLVVRAMNPNEADVILLRVLGDLSVTVIASIVGHTEEWVQGTYLHAMTRLRDVTEPTGVSPSGP